MPVPQDATTALPAPRPELVRPSEAAKPYTPAKTMEATTAARTSFVVLVLYRILRMSSAPLVSLRTGRTVCPVTRASAGGPLDTLAPGQTVLFSHAPPRS